MERSWDAEGERGGGERGAEKVDAEGVEEDYVVVCVDVDAGAGERVGDF